MPHYPDSNWQTFEHQVEALQRLCHSSTEDLPSPSRCLSALEELRQSLQLLIVDIPENLSVAGLGQRHVTELHRLLRLLLTDAALYQAARSVALRQQRFGHLCHHLAQLRQHAQAVVSVLIEP